MTYTRLDFLSRYCKKEEHNECYGVWYGLGIEASCYCKCHGTEGERSEASASVEWPLTNAKAIELPIQWRTQNGYS